MVDYTFNYDSEIKTIQVGNRLFNGFLRLDGKMSVKDEKSGEVSTAILEIPKIKLSSSLSLRLGKNCDEAVVSDFYFTGYGKIKKNYKKALKHYETVKTKSALLYPFYLSHSLFNIGLMNSFGFGVKKNITKAYMYYNATKNMKTAARYPAYLMIKFDEYINNSTINEIIIKVIKDCAMGLISPIWKIFLYLTFIVFYIGFFISIKSQKDT